MNGAPVVSLNGNSFWETSLEHDIDFCRHHGIGALAVPIRKVEAVGPERAVEQMAGSGLEIVSVIVPSIFDLADPGVWPAQTERLKGMIDVAAAAGAPTIYTTTGPAGSLGWEDAAAALRQALPEALAYAEQQGVRLLVEPTNPLYAHLSFVQSLADTVELARITGLGVVVDLFPVYQERGLRDTIRGLGGRVELVQISDYVPGPASAENPGGLNAANRAVPGDGVIPLAELLGLLLDGGYSGYLDLETFGPRITGEGEAAAVLRGVRWIEDFLRRRNEESEGAHVGV